MSDEEKRIRIAELCGWEPPSEAFGNYTMGGCKFMTSEEWRHIHLPDYLNDLNAMASAEAQRFSDDADPLLLNEWAYQVYIIARSNAEDKDVSLLRATARQRAEAFLLTLDAQPVSSSEAEPNGVSVSSPKENQ